MKGTDICHREDIHAVPVFTAANTDPLGPAHANLLSRFLWTSSRNTALMVSMLVLITRGSTTPACKCGFCASAMEASASGLDGVVVAWVDDTACMCGLRASM